MNRHLAISLIIASAMLAASGCARKAIVSDPYASPSYTSETDGQSAARGGAGGGDQSGQVQEESLEDADDRSRMLAAGVATDREQFENQDILFEFDSAVLSETAQKILRDKAGWLRANPNTRVIIEGHCDDRGTNEYNLALGEKRAQNTLNFLVTLGIDSSRMSTVSYGEERPLAAGTTEEARMKNRRAHFVIER